MKYFASYFCLLGLLTGCLNTNSSDMSEKSKAMYALGHRYAFKMRYLKPAEKDVDYFVKGINDGLKGSSIEGLDIEAALKKSEQIITKNKRLVATEKMGQQQKAVSEFILENDLIKSDTGLFYKIIEQGDSDDVVSKNRPFVRLRYVGKKLDGTVFDKTSDQNLPVFPISATIEAWKEAIPMIGVGGKILILAPSDLAFGAGGAPPKISGGESVIFELELVDTSSELPKS
ncbi:MAG: FKBP-type peptidyl-prolyl cis-trans isomerase [Bacteriovoracaceae bacterium]|nr:FKBP-type peptidyl-prolyl cis-trans isomerase [Bacteriovoracaceae bacterium]